MAFGRVGCPTASPADRRGARTLTTRRIVPAVLIAVTGTPGTGKTSACEVLARRGYTVIDLDEVARRDGFVTGRDAVRQTDEVDIEALRDGLNVPAKIAFLRSHFAHRMNVNVAIVLRCRPSVLRQRLEARGWGPEKVRENVEAEAIDVILQEAVTNLPFVYEVDTTDLTPEATADAILAVLQGKTKGHEPGSVDWTSEVLSWY
ncbi:MAG: dephospho-CoA kinase [Methanobacteriota archaeon]|nr:MAG: dephospho-CoA kinase [Euryarchaeota archaeon]TLZ83216.1 MAG: dephospho-CoA kinase [Euryarchaeota archaeon]